MSRYLLVAEKPSISKSVTEILSGGQYTTRQSSVKWIKNYDFAYRLANGREASFTMTAVTGHVTETEFADENLRGWRNCDPYDLFDAEIKAFVKKDGKGIASNLEREGRNKDVLMIWTDCDREGEHIGTEIADIVRKVNRGIKVERARFSAIIPAQIHQACRRPVALDLRQAAAVTARMDLDLRIGAALTRAQTLTLQGRFPVELDSKVLSYGPCQFPTLGFVVDQYEKVQNFTPETFWYIYVELEKEGEEKKTVFNWKRNRLFDWEATYVLYEMCVGDPEAEVVNVQTKPSQKWKPLPLTTVEMQKSGSRLLHMSPKRILETAEKLYQSGFVSYPRTETDQFDKDFNCQELVQKQATDTRWGAFAQMLTNGGFERPRNGKKNDKAHPPIHPTAHASNLNGDEKRVYELITRRFLACCSKNATGSLTTVDITISDEEFHTSGLVVHQRNYLDVYPYDKWDGSYVPDFRVGEKFMPSVCELREGQTTRPNLLTEADLVNLMDKNGIGTDATIAQHISMICDREYVMKQREGQTEYLLPSTLGIGLVDGYNRIGFEKSLSKPHLRREMEQRMVLICDGQRARREVLDETLDEYRQVFLKARQQFGTLIDSVGRYLQGNPGGNNRRGQQDNDDASDGDGGQDNDDDAPPPRPGNRGGRGGRGARGAGRGRGRGSGRQTNTRTNDADSGPDDNDDPPPPRPRAQQRKEPDAAHTEAEPPQCQCPDTAVERTVTRDSENKGRRFYTCSKPRDEGCKFFEWVDEAGSGTKKRPLAEQQRGQARQVRQRVNSNEEESALMCTCNLTANLKTVSKEGDNKGRQFFCCPNVSKQAQCRFFQWADENTQDGQAQRPRAAPQAGGSNYSCFKCGEEGHFSNACPGGGNAEAPSRTSSRGSRGRGRGRGKSRASKSTRGRRGERGAASKSNRRTFAALEEDD